MFHEDILYISYRKYIKTKFWLVICIAKNLIWTTLKGNFHALRFQILSQILSYHNKPYINGKIIYNHKFHKLTLMTGFVVQGHKCVKQYNVSIITILCIVKTLFNWLK